MLINFIAIFIKKFLIIYTKTYLKIHNLNKILTFGILVKNNFKLVDPIMEYYLKLGIKVIVFLNVYSEKIEVEMYQKYKENLILLDNDYKFIEPIVEQSSKYVLTDYYCFTASDEFFDLKALRKISKIVKLKKFETIGISRFWVGTENNFKKYINKKISNNFHLFIGVTSEMLRNRSPRMIDTQFRIFKPKDVIFNHQIGGFGFDVPENNRFQINFKKLNCCMFHLDWLVLSKEDRFRKLTFYDKLNPGIFEIERYYFLPEILDDIKIFKFNKLDLVSKELISNIIENQYRKI